MSQTEPRQRTGVIPRHGHTWTRNGKRGCSREYKTWQSMRERCYSEKHPKFHLYGGRGIKVCAGWESFDNFLADMGLKPKGMTLDRIDSNGNYEPGNCKWAGYYEQNRNRSNTRWFEKDGIRMTVAEWCRKIGQDYRLVNMRLYNGWPVDRALFTPNARGVQ